MHHFVLVVLSAAQLVAIADPVYELVAAISPTRGRNAVSADLRYDAMLLAANISLTPERKDKQTLHVTPRQRRLSDNVYGHILPVQNKHIEKSFARGKRLSQINLLQKSEANTYRDDDRFIQIKESAWRDLVLGNRCKKLTGNQGGTVCDGKFAEVQLTMPEGGVRNLTVQCQACKDVTTFTNSQGTILHRAQASGKRPGRGLQELRVRTVVSELLAGNTWESHQLRNSLAGMDKVGQESWYNVGSLVWDASCEAATLEFKRQCKAIKENGKPWIASGDGAWTHRGHRANGHVYPLFNKLTGKMVAMSVLQRDRYIQAKSDAADDGARPENLKVFDGGYKGSSRCN